MPNGVSGSFDLASNTGIKARVLYSETYDILANTSSLSLSLQISSSLYSAVTYYLNGPVNVDGTAVVTFNSIQGGHYVYISGLNAFCPVQAATSQYPAPPWSRGGIVHNADGSRSVTISLSLRGFTIAGDKGHGWAVSGSKTIALTSIPRASTVSATRANIGEVSIVTVNKRNSAYTHSVAYAFGGLTGYLTSSGGTADTEQRLSQTSIPFAIPTSFYAKIPNAQRGDCTLTCRTYSGSAQIGDAQSCTFTVVADAATCAPEVTGTVVDVNEATLALTGDENTLIRGCSTALCTLSATPKNAATIRVKGIAGNVVTGDTLEIPNVETNPFLFSVLDSRDYSGTYTVTKTMIPYVRLTNNASGKRTDPTSGNAVLTVSGEYFNGSFGAVDNILAVRYRVDGGDYVPVTPKVSGNSYTVSETMAGLEYTQAHTVEVEVSDKLATVTREFTVYKGEPVFDWGEDGFAFHVPVTAPGFQGAAKDYIDTVFTRPMAQFTDNDTINRYDLPGGIYRVAAGTEGAPVNVAGIMLHFGGYLEDTYNVQLYLTVEGITRVFIRYKWYYYGWRDWVQLG